MAAPEDVPWCCISKSKRLTRAKYHTWVPTELPARVLDALSETASPDAVTLCGIPLFFGFRSGISHMQPGAPNVDQRCKICVRGIGA